MFFINRDMINSCSLDFTDSDFKSESERKVAILYPQKAVIQANVPVCLTVHGESIKCEVVSMLWIVWEGPAQSNDNPI